MRRNRPFQHFQWPERQVESMLEAIWVHFGAYTSRRQDAHQRREAPYEHEPLGALSEPFRSPFRLHFGSVTEGK